MRTISACCLTVYEKSPGLDMFSAISCQPSALSFEHRTEREFFTGIVVYKVAEVNIAEENYCGEAVGKNAWRLIEVEIVSTERLPFGFARHQSSYYAAPRAARVKL